MITDGEGTRTFGYNAALQLETEELGSGKTITRTYDTVTVPGRPTGFNTGVDYSVVYDYDSKGRLNSFDWTVDGVAGTATYGYLADSDLIETLDTLAGQSTTYTYEPNRDVRTQVLNQFNASTVSQYDYEYDALARRSSVKNAGSAFSADAFNLFDYNARNELGESARYLGTDLGNLTNPVTSEYRGFEYDPIGNRETLTEGTATGTYTANNLNQYTAATLPANSFTFDEDGNLETISGIKDAVYTYDAENRLIVAEPSSPVVDDKKVDVGYDYLGRRTKKDTYTYNGASWILDAEKTFLYDGWNVIEEQTASLPTKYYVWGLDLSGSLQGAGGIGGLLSMVESATAYSYLYDGNGNVGQLVNNTGGAIEAHYEYDPYGNAIVASGALADANPFRFSTKYLDTETGLYYYGFRYYDPETGRWLSRDPIFESGHKIIRDGKEKDDYKKIALYVFVSNASINYFDPFGLWEIKSRPLGGPINILGELYYHKNIVKGHHWHVFFDDGTNIGYVLPDIEQKDAKGNIIVKPRIGADDPKFLSTYNNVPLFKGCDDNIMKEAVAKAKAYWEQRYASGQRYKHALEGLDTENKFDCQQFIWRTLYEYNKIRRDRGVTSKVTWSPLAIQ